MTHEIELGADTFADLTLDSDGAPLTHAQVLLRVRELLADRSARLSRRGSGLASFGNLSRQLVGQLDLMAGHGVAFCGAPDLPGDGGPDLLACGVDLIADPIVELLCAAVRLSAAICLTVAVHRQLLGWRRRSTPLK